MSLTNFSSTTAFLALFLSTPQSSFENGFMCSSIVVLILFTRSACFNFVKWWDCVVLLGSMVSVLKFTAKPVDSWCNNKKLFLAFSLFVMPLNPPWTLRTVFFLVRLCDQLQLLWRAYHYFATENPPSASICQTGESDSYKSYWEATKYCMITLLYFVLSVKW